MIPNDVPPVCGLLLDDTAGRWGSYAPRSTPSVLSSELAYLPADVVRVRPRRVARNDITVRCLHPSRRQAHSATPGFPEGSRAGGMLGDWTTSAPWRYTAIYQRRPTSWPSIEGHVCTARVFARELTALRHQPQRSVVSAGGAKADSVHPVVERAVLLCIWRLVPTRSRRAGREAAIAADPGGASSSKPSRPAPPLGARS